MMVLKCLQVCSLLLLLCKELSLQVTKLYKELSQLTIEQLAGCDSRVQCAAVGN